MENRPRGRPTYAEVEWATQQADRVDPIATTTTSILDKKAELARLHKVINPWDL